MANLKGKRVLVTGGAGFIGSHIVEQLRDEGCAQIVVLDNMVRGRPEILEHATALGSKTDISDKVFNVVPSYRIADVSSPRIVNSEALGSVVEEFARSITERSPSIIGGAEGARVVSMLERAQASLGATLHDLAKRRAGTQ